jgi:hypothetical protein
MARATRYLPLSDDPALPWISYGSCSSVRHLPHHGGRFTDTEHHRLLAEPEALAASEETVLPPGGGAGLPPAP